MKVIASAIVRHWISLLELFVVDVFLLHSSPTWIRRGFHYASTPPGKVASLLSDSRIKWPGFARFGLNVKWLIPTGDLRVKRFLWIRMCKKNPHKSASYYYNLVWIGTLGYNSGRVFSQTNLLFMQRCLLNYIELVIFYQLCVALVIK